MLSRAGLSQRSIHWPTCAVKWHTCRNPPITGNKKAGTSTVCGKLTGDSFPSTEAFITDPSGNTIFIGAEIEKKHLFRVHNIFSFRINNNNNVQNRRPPQRRATPQAGEGFSTLPLRVLPPAGDIGSSKNVMHLFKLNGILY